MAPGKEKGATVMNSRAAILNRIAKAGREPTTSVIAPQSDQSGCTHATLDTHTPDTDLWQRFTQRLKDNGITSRQCRDAAEIPTCVADLANITTSNPQRVCIAPHAMFQDRDWNTAGVSEMHYGSWKTGDGVAVSHARLGIADSGSLVLASGEDSPTGLAFLPEIHIIALQRNSLVATLTDAMVRFAEWKNMKRNSLPRAINIVSGASRTADIAGKIVHGAHGPRKLCVVIYDNA